MGASQQTDSKRKKTKVSKPQAPGPPAARWEAKQARQRSTQKDQNTGEKKTVSEPVSAPTKTENTSSKPKSPKKPRQSTVTPKQDQQSSMPSHAETSTQKVRTPKVSQDNPDESTPGEETQLESQKPESGSKKEEGWMTT